VLFVPMSDRYVRLRGSLICQCLTIFVPKIGVSAVLFKCIKHMGRYRDVVQ